MQDTCVDTGLILEPCSDLTRRRRALSLGGVEEEEDSRNRNVIESRMKSRREGKGSKQGTRNSRLVIAASRLI